MSTKVFRASVNGAIAAFMAAQFPTLDVVYENGPEPDERAITSVWLDTSIRFYAGNNVAVGNRSAGRDSGSLSLNVYCRKGEGTADADDLIEGLRELFRTLNLPGAKFYFSQRTVPTDQLGWYRTGLLVPFTVESP